MDFVEYIPAFEVRFFVSSIFPHFSATTGVSTGVFSTTFQIDLVGPRLGLGTRSRALSLSFRQVSLICRGFVNRGNWKGSSSFLTWMEFISVPFGFADSLRSVGSTRRMRLIRTLR